MVNENTIIKAIRQAGSIIEPSLAGYKYVKDDSVWPPIKYIPGGYCFSFPLECTSKPSKCLRLWYKNNGRPENPSHIINVSNYFNKYHVEYVIPYKYVDPVLKLTDGTEIPGVVMEWIEGNTLMRYVKNNFKNKVSIQSLADKFYKMAQYHKKYGMAHGDLSDENILVKPNGELFLIDYDSFYVWDWNKKIPQSTVGVEWYQHPERMNGKSHFLNTSMDYFSQQVIYLSLLVIAEDPSLFKIDTEKGLLFKGEDFASLMSFKASPMYKKISAIRNSEIQNRLHELERAMSGSLSEVRSIVDLNNCSPLGINIDTKAGFCGRCGHEFGINNLTDDYCPICGTKREIINES